MKEQLTTGEKIIIRASNWPPYEPGTYSIYYIVNADGTETLLPDGEYSFKGWGYPNFTIKDGRPSNHWYVSTKDSARKYFEG